MVCRLNFYNQQDTVIQTSKQHIIYQTLSQVCKKGTLSLRPFDGSTQSAWFTHRMGTTKLYRMIHDTLFFVLPDNLATDRLFANAHADLGSGNTSIIDSRTHDRDSRCFILSYLTYPYQPEGKIKTNDRTSAARLSHFDPWRHDNVKTKSPSRISTNSGFSGSHFSFFCNIKCGTLWWATQNNPLIVREWNRKIRPSRSPFVITRQASWCQSVILETDFSI